MPKAKREINLLNGTFVNSTTSQVSANTEAVYAPANYNGTMTFYMDVVYTNTSASTAQLQLAGKGGTQVTLAANTTSFTYLRTTLPSSALLGYSLLSLQCNAVTAGTVTVKVAKLIIIQDTGSSPITATESQFEIGNKETLTMAGSSTYPTNAVALSGPKYWEYEASKWDGNCTFTAEVVANTSGTMGYTFTAYLQEDDGNFGVWTDKVQIATATPNTTASRFRSAAFTPVNGRHYRLRVHLNSNMENLNIYCGKIIVTQTINSPTTTSSNTVTNSSYYQSSMGRWSGQSFPAGVGYLIGGAFDMNANGTGLTGNFRFALYESNGQGSNNDMPYNYSAPLAVSAWEDLSTLSTTRSMMKRYFTTPYYNGTAGKYYCLVIEFQNGVHPSGSFLVWNYTATTNPATGNYCASFDQGSTWAANNAGNDLAYEAYLSNYESWAITKFQEQYLVSNTTVTPGGLATTYARLDSTAWSGVTVNHRHVVDKDLTTTVTYTATLRTPDGMDVAGSSVNVSSQANGQLGSNERRAAVSQSTTTTSISLYNGSYTKVGNTHNSNGQMLHSIRFNLKKVGNPTGIAVATVYALTGSFDTTTIPVGEPIVRSTPVDVSTLGTTSAPIDFYFLGQDLQYNTSQYYAACLEYSGGDASNYILADYATTTSAWSGNMVYYSGGSWSTPGNGSDLGFVVYTGSNTLAPLALTDSQTTTIDTDLSQYAGNRRAQSFTSQGGIIRKVILKLKKVGTPTGTYRVKIYAHSGTYGSTSVATGVAVAESDPLAVSVVTTGYQDYTFGFSGANKVYLYPSTYYVLALEHVDGFDDVSNMVWVGGYSTSVHSGNAVNYWDGVWSETPALDMYFMVYTEAVSEIVDVYKTVSGAMHSSKIITDVVVNQKNTVIKHDAITVTVGYS